MTKKGNLFFEIAFRPTPGKWKSSVLLQTPREIGELPLGILPEASWETFSTKCSRSSPTPVRTARVSLTTWKTSAEQCPNVDGPRRPHARAQVRGARILHEGLIRGSRKTYTTQGGADGASPSGPNIFPPRFRPGRRRGTCAWCPSEQLEGFPGLGDPRSAATLADYGGFAWSTQFLSSLAGEFPFWRPFRLVGGTPSPPHRIWRRLLLLGLEVICASPGTEHCRRPETSAPRRHSRSRPPGEIPYRAASPHCFPRCA